MGFRRLLAKGLRELLQPPAITNSTIDRTSRVCSGTHVNNSTIDRYSYIGHDGFVLKARIGGFCSIADGCRIGGASHNVARVSTSPVFSKGRNVLGKNFARFDDAETPITSISPDVWIGAESIILSGVQIGVGAVVGAGSVVTKNVPPYAIVAGCPARLLRYRFPEDTVKSLIETEWWSWSEEELEGLSRYFDNPGLLCSTWKKMRTS